MYLIFPPKFRVPWAASGVSLMKQAEDLASLFLGRRSDLTDIIQESELNSLQMVFANPPSQPALSQAVYSVMAAELLSRPRGGSALATLQKDVTGFTRFASQTLSLSKKDSPGVFSAKLDKLQKDLPLRCTLHAGQGFSLGFRFTCRLGFSEALGGFWFRSLGRGS